MQKLIIPMRGRLMHSAQSEPSFNRTGRTTTEVINSISRADLKMALMNSAEAARSKNLF